MAWQHFTDWLEPGGIVTPQMIGELWAALEERDLFNEILNLNTYAPEIITNRHKELNTFENTLENRISAVASSNLTYRYVVLGNDENASAYNRWFFGTLAQGFDLFYEAAQDLGVSDSSLFSMYDPANPDVWSLNRLSLSDYWNVMKRSIQMMDLVQRDNDTTVHSRAEKSVSGEETWQDAVDAYNQLSEQIGEGAGVEARHGDDGNFFITQARLVRTHSNPSLPGALTVSEKFWRVYAASPVSFLEFSGNALDVNDGLQNINLNIENRGSDLPMEFIEDGGQEVNKLKMVSYDDASLLTEPNEESLQAALQGHNIGQYRLVGWNFP